MKQRRLITIFTVLAVIMLCACNQNELRLADSGFNYPAAPPNEMQSEPNTQAESPQTEPITQLERKIVKKGDVRFQTTDVKRTKSLIYGKVNELQGYIAEDNVYDYEERIEHRLVIRVPANQFDALLHTISENAERFDSQHIDVQDVTEEFIDVEARIKTKKELQSRYTELLKRATKIDEMLQIEKEIGDLQTEIESVEGRMRYLKDRIAFSSLTVSYYQQTTLGFGFASKFVDGLKSGWNFFLWFIIGLSHLWVFLLIVFVSVFLFRRWRKRRKQRSANNQQ
ncbi:MAG: DUF4349 domain-containing protein [Tannerella sp.]|jgi:hypothetical protein|nr:DUF4349 domain-containing protein [Tannerella sp.]